MVETWCGDDQGDPDVVLNLSTGRLAIYKSYFQPYDFRFDHESRETPE